MLIIPAIDLKDGQVVRYAKGRLNKTVYSSEPAAVALDWQRQGARFLHLVDLDGAMSGRQKNLKFIKKIIKAVKIPVEVGGGIRDLGTIKKIITYGAERVILGTRAIEDIGFLENAIKRFGNKIALSLDARGKRLGLYGWKKSLKSGIIQLLKKLKNLRLKTIIYTDITRDGTLRGLNIQAIKNILETTSIDVIVSGGVSSLNDIKKLLELKMPNLKGVIVGKALYEKRFSLQEAIAVQKRGRASPVSFAQCDYAYQKNNSLS